MAIFRGTGGSGDATANVTINQVTEKALEAEASATAAASSASDAATSATAASTSATSAATSATASANSATAAQTAQTAAETAQTAAELAQTNAETAETNSAASATASATSASAASVSASNALTSATNAASSASNALTSANNAATSATSAASSATDADTRADDAYKYAVYTPGSYFYDSDGNLGYSAFHYAQSASSSASSAQSALNSTLAVFDSFDDRYLGAKASDPTVDNDGNALLAGAIYFNTTIDAMKVYTGSAWVLTYADLATATTDDLAEGSNLYYTDARANSAIDTRVTKTFVEGLTIDITEAQITDLVHYTDTDANAAIDARVTQTFVNNLNVDADTLDGLNSTDFDPAGTAVALAIALG